MRLKKLGNTGLLVSELCLGTSGQSEIMTGQALRNLGIPRDQLCR